MINQEYYQTRSDGVVLTRTYSDAGMKILQRETGILYDEAIDVEPLQYTYKETIIPIEEPEEPEEEPEEEVEDNAEE